MRYRIKDGFHVKTEADIVAAELDRIRSIHGGKLVPQAVVDEARDKSSPIHGEFEWNNKKAAENYRITQANYLIRSVMLVSETKDTAVPVRYYVSINDPDEDPVSNRQFYTSIEEAMSNPKMREVILERARRDVLVWRKKYHALVEFADLFELIDRQIA